MMTIRAMSMADAAPETRSPARNGIPHGPPPCARRRQDRILDDHATWNEDKCRVRSGHGPEMLGCLRRLAIGLILGRGKPVAPTIRDLNRKPCLVFDWLRLNWNTQPRTKSAA